MKIAIISLTKNGAILANSIYDKINKEYNTVDLYEKSGREAKLKNTIKYEKLANLINEIFTSYDAIICIMALGIVMRVIAKQIVHKSQDPAILVVDEQGNFVISALSGHLGGANELSKSISNLIKATPVITTATDVQGKIAPDIIAKKINAKIEDFDYLRLMNAMIVDGVDPIYYIDKDLYSYHQISDCCKKNELEYRDLIRTNINYEKPAVYITDKLIKDFIEQGYNNEQNQLILRPQTLAVGIGCRKGTPRKMIEGALVQAMQSIGYSLASISIMASVDLKANEEGLIELSKQFNIPIKFYGTNELLSVIKENNLEESDFVKEIIGVGNVCEAAAIKVAKSHEVILKKTKYPMATIAVVKVN